MKPRLLETLGARRDGGRSSGERTLASPVGAWPPPHAEQSTWILTRGRDDGICHVAREKKRNATSGQTRADGWMNASSTHATYAAVAVALVCVALLLCVRRPRAVRMLVPPDCTGAEECYTFDVVGDVNRMLVVDGRVGSRGMLFMLDTGYAGAPVLHLPALVCEGQLGHKGTVAQRATALLDSLRTPATQSEQEQALATFVHEQACTEYTAGCTTRLMGIGTTQENTSDLILAPALELRTARGEYAAPRACAGLPLADLFSTSRNASLHILTIDFLLAAAPCLVSFERRCIQFSLPPERFLLERARSTVCATEFSGGSFVATLRVAGQEMRCTVDTGASSYVSLSKSAAARVRRCASQRPVHLTQRGVNGEVICSDVVECDVDFAGAHLQGIPVFLNSLDIEDVDGYVGISLLSAFDLLMTPGALACRLSGEPADPAALLDVAREGFCDRAPRCAEGGEASP